MTRFARAAGGAALLTVAAPLVAGCGFFAGMAQGPADDLTTWSAQPLPPDPALTAEAIGENSPCVMDDNEDDIPPAPPRVLVQDRRMQNTAAFLVQTAEHFGSCLISRWSGSGASWGPPLEASDGPLTIDDARSQTLAHGAVTELGGRVGLEGARVVVRLENGREVIASTANGFWLAWWPATDRAIEVAALDGLGKELASVVPPQ